MINPNDDDFIEDNPLAAPIQASEADLSERDSRLRRTAGRVTTAAGDTWNQTKRTAGAARDRTEFFLRENPIPTIVGALAVGLAIGLAIRYAATPEEKEVEIKSPLGNMSWSFLSLPFLLPFFKSVREKYEDSTDVVKDSVGRLKEIDLHRYAKPLRKRWKAWMR
jgi:ElaB/YqjD/DUF883 family membrane-anchored ribosome-binding protein